MASSVFKHIGKHGATNTSPATVYPSVMAEYAMEASLYIVSTFYEDLIGLFLPHGVMVALQFKNQEST